MYWIVSDIERTRTLSIPYYVPGEIQDFNATLVVEDGETFTQAYLCLIDPFFLGYISAAIGTADYVELGGRYNSACFLGSLVGPAAVNVAFRIEMDATVPGAEYMIAIGLYSGQDCPGGPSFLLSDVDETDFPLWGEDEHDSPLWNGAGGPPPFWVSGSRCARAEYAWAKPGVTLAKNDLICVDSDKELQLAQTGGTQGEAIVFGIVDDASDNYMHHVDGAVISDGEGSIYWQGGHVGGNILDTVHRWDYLTRQYWLLDDTDLGGRIYHTGVWYGGKFYVWGGRSRAGVALNTIYVFDPELVTWTALTAGGTARFLHAAMLVGDAIHFVGGVNAAGSVVLTTDIYSLTGDSWSTGTSAPAALSALDIALSPLARPVWQVCGTTLFYGGSTAGRDEQFFTYTSAGVWAAPAPLADVATPGRNIAPNVPFQPVNSLPQNCVRLLPFGVYGMPVWVGMPTGAGESTAETYLEDCGKWGTLTLDVRRVLTQGFVTDATWAYTIGQQPYLSATPGAWTTTRPEVSFIVVCGEAVSATTICFNPTSPFYTWDSWEGSALIGDGINYLYEFGGDDGTGVTGRLRALNLTTLTWTELTSGCTARRDAGITIVGGVIYVVGGLDVDDNILSTMCTYNTFTDTWTAAEATGIDPVYDTTVIAEPWQNEGTYAGEWTDGWTYFENDVVYLDGVYYQATQDQVADISNAPKTGVEWEDYWTVVAQTNAWAESVSVVDGQMVTHGGATYVATSDHITAVATEPGVGVDWDTVWDIAYLAPEWVTGTDYADNAIVESGGTYYVATSAHTAGASTEPGVGVDWETVWDEVAEWQTGQLYAVGTVLYHENHFYIVTVEHTSAALTEPGVGDDWATVFDVVDIDTTWQAGLSVTAGDACLVEDVWYIAIDSHTTTANDEPGVGVNWEDHWTVAIQSTPNIYVVDGIGTSGVTGGVNILDTSTGIWITGPEAPAEFIDDMTVASSDFENVVETQLALSESIPNQWMCTGGDTWSAAVALGATVYMVGQYHYTAYPGDPGIRKMTLTPYDPALDDWGESIELTGDYANLEFPFGMTYPMDVFGYDGYIYLFGHFTHIESADLCYGVLKINPSTENVIYVTRIRSGEIEYGVTDRLNSTCNYYDGQMYVYGGTGTVATKLDVFNFTTGVFDVGTEDLGVERRGHAATIYDGLMYLYYGRCGGGSIDSTPNTIDLTTDAYASWTIPASFNMDEVGYENGQNGILGDPWGYDDDGNLYMQSGDSFNMFDPSSDTWARALATPSHFYQEVNCMFAYYSGALYYERCETDNPRMYAVTLSTTTITPMVIKTFSYVDGYPAITYTTISEDGTSIRTWTFSLTTSGTSSSGSSSAWKYEEPRADPAATAATSGGITETTIYSGTTHGAVQAMAMTIQRQSNGMIKVVKAIPL